MGHVEDADVCPNCLAFGYYSLEPDREFVSSIVDDMTLFFVERVDLGPFRLRYSRRETGLAVVEKAELLRGRRGLGLDLQILCRKA